VVFYKGPFSLIFYAGINIWEYIGGCAVFSCIMNTAHLCSINVEKAIFLDFINGGFASSPKPDALPDCATPRCHCYVK